MDLSKIIIEPHYFPCIDYFSLLLKAEEIIFNDEQFFRKQSYKNRCHISSANKVLPLIVPLKQGKSKLPYKDVGIDYSTSWQKLHWTSIVSAYNSSPYFLHYRDYIEPYFQGSPSKIMEMNIDIIKNILSLLDSDKEMTLLSEARNVKATELSNFIHPKRQHNQLHFQTREYYQVFSERFGFIENMSILDLLFNEGPGARLLLNDAQLTSS